jgi:hypothetical protein
MLLRLVLVVFWTISGIHGIFHFILSVKGGRNQTCRDEQFDVQIVPICSADRERRRLNRFYRICGLDLGKGSILWGVRRSGPVIQARVFQAHFYWDLNVIQAQYNFLCFSNLGKSVRKINSIFDKLILKSFRS